VEDDVRRKAVPCVTVTARVTLDVEERLHRLLAQYGDSVPELLDRALNALEARTAETSAA
jgi:hypothetical protein